MMQRIIWHWTAGSYIPNAEDRDHYHFLIDGNGNVIAGTHAVEDNLDTSDDDYAAHTKNLNTGSIGVALCAMFEAVDYPFNVGDYPIKPVQVDLLVRLTSDLVDKYGILVGKTTILSHAEVEPTLGIDQNAKWDISWLPGMSEPDDPVKVGTQLRKMVVEYRSPKSPPMGDTTATLAEYGRRLDALEKWAASFVGDGK